MTCNEVQTRVEVRRAGGLPENERVAFDAHVEACQTCRALLAAGIALPSRSGFRQFTPLLAAGALAVVAVAIMRRDVPTTPGGGGASSTTGGAPTAPAGASGTPVGPGAVPAGVGDIGAPSAAPGQESPPGPGAITVMTPSGPVQFRPGGAPPAPTDGVKEATPPVTPERVGPVWPKGPDAPLGAAPPQPVPGPGPGVAPTEPEGVGPRSLDRPASTPDAPTPPVIPAPPGGPDAALPGAPSDGTPAGTPESPRIPGSPPRPASAGRGDRPLAPGSPEDPAGSAATPATTAGTPPGGGETDASRRSRQVLRDPDRSLADRRDAARALGTQKALDAVLDLTEVLERETDPGLRAASAEALGALGDPSGVGPLRRALEAEPPGAFGVVASLAEALRRLRQSAYLEDRLRVDVHDLSPRIRARGALAAGAGELVRLGARLCDLLDDRHYVATARPVLDGRAVPGVAGDRADLEVRHFAWRALTRLVGGADLGFDAAAWRRAVTALRTELAGVVPAGELPPPAAPPDLTGRGAEPFGKAVTLAAGILASRDPALAEACVGALRASLAPATLPAAPREPWREWLRGLPAFSSAEARDAFCAPFYAAVVLSRERPPADAWRGLRDAAREGRAVLVSRLGAGGLPPLVERLAATARDPEACYGDGGVLWQILRGFATGQVESRPWLERGTKDAEARGADAGAFARAVTDIQGWLAAIGPDARWDEAAGVVRGKTN